MISNSGSDERGKYTGGQAGDQTGNEWQLRTWYNRPWNVMLRYPDRNVAQEMANLAVKAANNNKIGYNQDDRYSYWQQLSASNYDPAQIKVACNADCSAGVAANVKATGYRLNIDKLKNVSIYCYTGNLKDALVKAGFKAYTDSKYLTSDEYLLPGDVLLYEGHHTCMNVTAGAKTGIITSSGDSLNNSTNNSSNNSSTSSYLSVGDKGAAVKEMQKMLIACGYDCGSSGADGDFGNGTKSALVSYQKNHGLEADGKYGPKSKETLTTEYKKRTKEQEISLKQGKNGMWVRTDGGSLNVRNVPNGPTVVKQLPNNKNIKCDKRIWYSGTCYFHIVNTGWIDGRYIEGWVGESNKWWYVNKGYTYKKNNWQKIDGSWYFFDKDGWMMHDTWIEWDGHKYYLRSWGGCCINGEYTIDGKKYTFNSWGGLVE